MKFPVNIPRERQFKKTTPYKDLIKEDGTAVWQIVPWRLISLVIQTRVFCCILGDLADVCETIVIVFFLQMLAKR